MIKDVESSLDRHSPDVRRMAATVFENIFNEWGVGCSEYIMNPSRVLDFCRQ